MLLRTVELSAVPMVDSLKILQLAVCVDVSKASN